MEAISKYTKSNRTDWRYCWRSSNAVALKGGHSRLDSAVGSLFQGKATRVKLFNAKIWHPSLKLLSPNKKKLQILQLNIRGIGTHSWPCDNPSKRWGWFPEPNFSQRVIPISVKKCLFHLSLLHPFLCSPLPTSPSIYRRLPEYCQQITHKRREVKELT